MADFRPLDLILNIPHDMTEQQQRHRYELHTLYREWKADDRDAQQDATQRQKVSGLFFVKPDQDNKPDTFLNHCPFNRDAI